MLNFGNKEFRNLQEQVYENMKNISELADLALVGINVDYIVDTVADLEAIENPEAGSIAAVGTEKPYTIYVYYSDAWVNFGQFPMPGPQGPQGSQGPEGPKGDIGQRGPKGETGASGRDGLTTSINVNNKTYTQVNGVISLPNYVKPSEIKAVTFSDTQVSGGIDLGSIAIGEEIWNIPDGGKPTVSDFTAGPGIVIDEDLAHDTVSIEVDQESIPFKVDLATVAFSGDYDDLTDKPSIPAAQVNSDWNAISGVAEILNKPSLATVATTGDYDDLLNKPVIPSALVAGDDITITSNVIETVYGGSLSQISACQNTTMIWGTYGVYDQYRCKVSDGTVTADQVTADAEAFKAHSVAVGTSGTIPGYIYLSNDGVNWEYQISMTATATSTSWPNYTIYCKKLGITNGDFRIQTGNYMQEFLNSGLAGRIYYKDTYWDYCKFEFSAQEAKVAIDDDFISSNIARVSQIPADVTGVNNGVNWTSITIGADTYGIPSGGGQALVAGQDIDITNDTISTIYEGAKTYDPGVDITNTDMVWGTYGTYTQYRCSTNDSTITAEQLAIENEEWKAVSVALGNNTQIDLIIYISTDGTNWDSFNATGVVHGTSYPRYDQITCSDLGISAGDFRIQTSYNQEFFNPNTGGPINYGGVNYSYCKIQYVHNAGYIYTPINKNYIPVNNTSIVFNAYNELAVNDSYINYNNLQNLPTIPDAVSGVNDGTNWTSLTIGSDTYGIGGGSAPSNMVTTDTAQTISGIKLFENSSGVLKLRNTAASYGSGAILKAMSNGTDLVISSGINNYAGNSLLRIRFSANSQDCCNLIPESNIGSGVINIAKLGTETNPFTEAHITTTLVMKSLPTTDPQVAGQVWNDNGTLKVSSGV